MGKSRSRRTRKRRGGKPPSVASQQLYAEEREKLRLSRQAAPVQGSAAPTLAQRAVAAKSAAASKIQGAWRKKIAGKRKKRRSKSKRRHKKSKSRKSKRKKRRRRKSKRRRSRSRSRSRRRR